MQTVKKISTTSKKGVSVLSRCTYDVDSEYSIKKDIADAPPKPEPTDFDTFIPWVCTQWCASTTVVVTKLQQEKYHPIKTSATKSSRVRHFKSKILPSKHSLFYQNINTSSSLSSDIGLDVMGAECADVVPIKAYYNNKNQLVEISIIGCPNISRKVIQAFSLSIPYQPALNRLTIRRGGLDCMLIYEIYKLIPYSNITEICFDDSYVREGNYYILLEQISQLKSLSLNRCGINDEICLKIAMNLEHGSPVANSLQILELGSNNISDSGAQSLAQMLRANRSLLHINLSGNEITDVGFLAILNTLKEFRLTKEECIGMHRRKLRYLQNKLAVYERCLEELMRSKSDEENSDATLGRKKSNAVVSSKRRHRKFRKTIIPGENLKEQAEFMARGIVGEYRDPFSPNDIEVREGVYYSRGNLTLCSINIAYNNLAYSSVRQLYDVLLYQEDIDILVPDTGLIRVTLDGNYIPKTCMELEVIDVCFTNVIAGRIPARRKTSTSSSLRRLIAKQQANFD